MKIIIILFISISSFSQTAIKKSSIDSGGTIESNGTTQVIYSIGEIAVQEQNAGNIHLSEGFIGKDIQQTLGVSNLELFNGFEVYPNPTIDYINIKFNQTSNYNIMISDVYGKVIQERNTIQRITTLNLSKLNQGVYFIVIKDITNNTYNSVKIIKN